MNNLFTDIKQELKITPKSWLITGVAGFIGSNLLQELLSLNQIVKGIDNFSTGHVRNLNDVKSSVSAEQWNNFKFIEGDIANIDDCVLACQGVDYVLHQAALGSVPRSIKNPLATNLSNINGTLNMLVAAKDEKVKKFVYASSSSVYGDNPDLPKVEKSIGLPLSPYAVTKYTAELYTKVFANIYGLKVIGLRYFNVFGPRQNPEGDYAAVIPLWTKNIIEGNPIFINGDGLTSRDFCFVENVIQMNLLAATNNNPEAANQVYNVAFNATTPLKVLLDMIYEEVVKYRPDIKSVERVYREFRPGDIKHSLADITKAKTLLGYGPQYDLASGLKKAIPWYIEHLT